MKKVLLFIFAFVAFANLQSQNISQEITNLKELRNKVISLNGASNAMSDDIGDAEQTLILISQEYCFPLDSLVADSSVTSITNIAGVQSWLVGYKVNVEDNIEGLLYSVPCVPLVKSDFIMFLIAKYQTAILDAAYYN